MLDRLESFLTSTLGKGVVRAKDTPNFIGNRIGIFSILATFKEVENFGLTYDVVDDLTGDKLGRAKSGTFRTADVVGLDTMAHVIRTMQDNLKDSFAAVYETPPVLKAPDRQGRARPEDGRGLLPQGRQGHPAPRPGKADYVPSGAKADETVVRILKKKTWAERHQAAARIEEPAGAVRLGDPAQYLPLRGADLEEIADTARDVDFAMRWGFGQKQGPFEIWQQAGWQQVARWINEDIDAGKALVEASRCRRGCSRGRWPTRAACTSRKARGRRRARAFVPRSDLPVYQRPAVPRAAAWARQRRRNAPVDDACSRTTRSALWTCGEAGVDGC